MPRSSAVSKPTRIAARRAASVSCAASAGIVNSSVWLPALTTNSRLYEWASQSSRRPTGLIRRVSARVCAPMERFTTRTLGAAAGWFPSPFTIRLIAR